MPQNFMYNRAMNKKAKLTIIRGLPGSGKSTYAKANYKCLILENDMFHIQNGAYNYSVNNMKMAILWCKSACETALSNGMDVVVANTFTKRRFIEVYRQLAERYGAEFEVVRCSGNYGNIHDVPKMVLESMKNSFEDWEGETVV